MTTLDPTLGYAPYWASRETQITIRGFTVTWRVISYGDGVWRVDPIAERPPHARSWQLVLSFRLTSGRMRERALWAPYPLEAASRSALFLQADKIRDVELSRVLAATLA
jgi:hypothetical protein